MKEEKLYKQEAFERLYRKILNIGVQEKQLELFEQEDPFAVFELEDRFGMLDEFEYVNRKVHRDYKMFIYGYNTCLKEVEQIVESLKEDQSED